MPKMPKKPEKPRKEKPRLATLACCAASEGCVTRRDAFVNLMPLNALAGSLCQTVVSLVVLSQYALRIRGVWFR